MPLIKTWNSTSYSIPQSGERGWPSLTNFLAALADSAQTTNKQLIGRRLATTTPVSVTSTTDAYIGVNVPTTPAVVNLPAGVNGQIFIVADESDAAATYNITINPSGGNTINSASSFVITKNSQSIFLVFSGSDWVVISNTQASGSISSAVDSSEIDFTVSAGGALSASLIDGGVPRTRLASGSANHVIINSAGGVLSSEATLAATRGGTGFANASTFNWGGSALAFTTSGSTTLTLPTSGTVVTIAGVQALTNKDLDGGTASNSSRVTIPKNTTSNLNALTRKQGTVVYDTTLNKLKYDDGTNLNLVGSGTGSGGDINYISNGDFEDGTITGWATYADAAGSTPVDGTGGSPASTFTIDSSTQIRGTYGGLWTKSAANRQGEGFSYAFSIRSIDAGKVLQITFDSIASANMVNGDIGIYIYDVTNAVLISPAVIALPTASSSQYSVNFNASTSLSYRLIFHTATTSALAYTINVDNFSISPVVRPLVPAVSDYLSWTPSITGFGTVSNLVAKYKRIGDFLQAEISFLAGTSSASNGTISLPTGLTIDTSKLSIVSASTVRSAICGNWAVDNSGTNDDGLLLISGSTSTTSVYFAPSRGTTTNHTIPSTSIAGNVSAGSTYIIATFSAPISQWSSNITLASTVLAKEYIYNSSGLTTAGATNSTAYGYGAAGAAIGNIASSTNTGNSQTFFQCRFQNPIQQTDKVNLEINDGINPTWLEVGNTLFNAVQNGVCNTGMYVSQINSTDVQVSFGNAGAFPGATYGALSSSPWSTYPTFRWRVVKYSGVGGTELSPATASSAGTISRESRWVAYTPTASAGFGTVTGMSGYYCVSGYTLKIRVTFTTGTVAATTASISLPAGFQIDPGAILNSTTASTDSPNIGLYQHSATTKGGSVIACVTTSDTNVYFANGFAGATGLGASTGTTAFTNAKFTTFFCEVPIL